MFKYSARFLHNTHTRYFNPHQVLGVQQNASQDEIKRAYRKLAKKHHPDLSNSNKEKFQEVQKAYDILSGKEKPEQSPGQGGQGGFNPFGAGGFNPFSGFGGFGGFSGGSTGGANPFDFMEQERPTELELRLSVDFIDAVTGSTMTINTRLPTDCKPCKGKGTTKSTVCSVCKGKGSMERVLQGMYMRISCPTCGGTGHSQVACNSCKGSGYTQEPKTLRIKIPPKTTNNTTIKIYHENKTIYVTIRVKPHPTFRQTPSGSAECTVKIGILKAILGGTVKAPTLRGTTTLNIKPGLQLRDKVVENDVQYVFDFDMALSDSERTRIKRAFENEKSNVSATNARNESGTTKVDNNEQQQPTSKKDQQSSDEQKGFLGCVKDKFNKYIHPDTKSK